MGLTQALFTGLSGLTVNSQAVSVAGNNIANANTTAFKSSRVDFETSISQNLKPASGPSDLLGGSNPAQVGVGVRVGGVSRDFTNGSVSPTGRNTDMAIEGGGFFMVALGGRTQYTRAGAFSLDRDFNLVDPSGGKVQGYGIDNQFNIVEGLMQDVNVPIGSLTLAEATRNVRFNGNLNSSGETATAGALLQTAPVIDPNQPGGFADVTSLLTDLQNSGGGALFVTGDVITVTGVEKGGGTLPDKTFEVGPTKTGDADAFGETMGDFLTFLDSIFGIDSSADPAAGVSIDPTTGVISVQGNKGEVNNLAFESTNIVKNLGVAPQLPFAFDAINAANGESVRTTFVAFDSLGAPMAIDLNLVLEEKTNNGTLWRFFAQSEDDTDLDRALGTGMLSFDINGQLTSVNNGTFQVDRVDTGAANPQLIKLDFRSGEGALSALADTTSQVTAISQDGSPIGTLNDFTVQENGELTGVFSNGLLRPLGRIVMASFSNPGGLLEVGNNLFEPTANSGTASIVNPGTGGTGRIVGGALELSNVDLSQEFISLITASTGFSASSRVLSTSEQLLQELLAVVR